MSRSRSRDGRPPVGLLAVALAVCLLLAGGFGAAAFSTGRVDRASDVAVARDAAGVLGVDRATAVHTNATDPLVNVTNRLGRDVTLTVALRPDSTSRGDLVVDGRNVGDRATVSLADGTTRRVEVTVPDDASYVGTRLAFDVRGSAPGLVVSGQNRTVPIRSGNA